MNTSTEPERLQKLLARAGLGSRRQIERWIDAGEISVNGKTASLGTRATVADRIRLRGRLLDLAAVRSRPPRVLIYNKPEGEVCTRRDPEGRPTVFRNLPKGRWISVGRLDINTQGLLLFTDDGELAHRLMHPATGVEREYAIRVRGSLDEAQKRRLLEGVVLEDGPARFDSLVPGNSGEGANQWYHAVLREGRKREVRRLLDAVGLSVSRLIRVRYAGVALPRALRAGKWQMLEAAQVQGLYHMAGLECPAARPAEAAPARRKQAGAPRRSAPNAPRRWR